VAEDLMFSGNKDVMCKDRGVARAMAGVLAAGLLMLASPALSQVPARTAAASPAVTQLSGAWELTSQGGARKCRVTLRPSEAKGGRALGFPATCRRTLPILGKVSAWNVSDDGFVRLVDGDGKPVLSFEDDAAALKLKASADGTEYQFDALGKPRRFVPRVAAVAPPRVAFDPAKAPPRESIPGLYGMLRYGGQEVCRISLGTNPGAADGRFLAEYPTRCRDKGLQVFDAVAWRYTGGKVHLIARRGHEMVLVSTGEGVWQKDPPGGSELTLRRVKN
jgi:hypothetical protein